MTDPTNEHREQARAILRACEERTGMDLASDSLPNDLADRVAFALSSRDTEIREVLEGLGDDDCYDACFLRWMKRYEDSDGFEHSEACLAARALYAKLQPLQSENPGDSLRQ